MLTIRKPSDVQDLLDLALEVTEIEQCSWKDAVIRSVELMPRLACDVANDLRYGPPEPPIEVHTSWSVPPRARGVELPAVAVRQSAVAG